VGGPSSYLLLNERYGFVTVSVCTT
jgi:hypothetical protein